jgi:hypothetical protein
LGGVLAQEYKQKAEAGLKRRIVSNVTAVDTVYDADAVVGVMLRLVEDPAPGAGREPTKAVVRDSAVVDEMFAGLAGCTSGVLEWLNVSSHHIELLSAFDVRGQVYTGDQDAETGAVLVVAFKGTV